MTTTLFAVLTLTAVAAGVDQHQAGHAGHDAHAAMNARGAKAMGFDQTRATHHFILRADGGFIEVTANDANDDEVRTQVVAHLEHITTAFKTGDFAIPAETHAELPPGAADMAAAKAHITYTFEAVPNGGRVRITGSTPAALDAIHTFLRYQIAEHRTGDPTTPR